MPPAHSTTKQKPGLGATTMATWSHTDAVKHLVTLEAA